jgi:hypothetical protein
MPQAGKPAAGTAAARSTWRASSQQAGNLSLVSQLHRGVRLACRPSFGCISNLVPNGCSARSPVSRRKSDDSVGFRAQIGDEVAWRWGTGSLLVPY